MSTLTEARARLAAITPGEWKMEYWSTPTHEGIVVVAEPERDIVAHMQTHVAFEKWSDWLREKLKTDLSFIAHAPADLAAAFSRIAELEAALKGILDARDRCNECIGFILPCGECNELIHVALLRAAELLKESA